MTENSGGLIENEEARKILFNWAIRGKWDEAMKVYRQYAWLREEKITIDGDTALHLAVRDRQERVVEEMVGLVRTEKLYEGVIKLQNEQGNTPLHLAASIGNLPICRCLLLSKRKGGTGVGQEDDHDLLSIRNKDGENPLFLAARHGGVEPFLFLQHRAPRSGLSRNKRGETILHYALDAGRFPLAFLVITKYDKEDEDLITTYDENGVSPLHLLARHPAAFKSGTRLRLLDKIIYHCTFYSEVKDESCDSEDAEKWFGRAAMRQKLLNLLPEPWRDNIRALFSFAFTFIRICVNPSSGARADEENRLTGHDQGPPHERSTYESGKRSSVGLSLPPNYDTCFNLIMFSVKTVLIFFGKGRSYFDWIRENKTNHVLSAKILEKILDKYRGRWYDSTGKNPLYKDRSIPYKEGELPLGEIPQLQPGMGQVYGGNSDSRSEIGASKQPEGVQRPPDLVHKQPNQEVQRSIDSINEGVQRPPDLMHKLLEEVQRSSDSMNKLLEEAQTNELLTVLKDKNQKLHKSLKEDSDWALMQTLSKGINQTAKKVADELLSEDGEKGKVLEAPILTAAKNGIKEMVESILNCFPEAILDTTREKKNVVLLAAEHRRPYVYDLLVKRPDVMTDSVFGQVDGNGNSALHLAAMFTDSRPWLTPGAALQIQWEVKWFEYVRDSKPSNCFSIPNEKGESPHQIFTERHKDLVQQGGEWLTKTATSCSVVSTLITTVAFATSSTVPGGNNDSGVAPLQSEPAFHVFTIASLVALCSSTAATILFLAILTSRNREREFAKDLSTKLLAGLTSLFVSMLAILVSFCSAHFFELQKELKSYALPIYTVTCLPVTLFAIAQLPLYLDLMLTTFRPMPQPRLDEDS